MPDKILIDEPVEKKDEIPTGYAKAEDVRYVAKKYKGFNRYAVFYAIYDPVKEKDFVVRGALKNAIDGSIRLYPNIEGAEAVANSLNQRREEAIKQHAIQKKRIEDEKKKKLTSKKPNNVKKKTT